MTKPNENNRRSLERHTHPSPAPTVTLHECENSHVFFFPHESCPRCSAPLVRIESPPDAVIVSHTTVRVGPADAPFGLGLVRVARGAQTLCIMDGDFQNRGAREVLIEKRGGLFYARAKTSA